jgi:ABC-type antimicrobial peptide transport system permease subunit
MNGDLTPGILAIAVFCGILTAIIGAILPAMRAARIQPYEAMRTER